MGLNAPETRNMNAATEKVTTKTAAATLKGEEAGLIFADGSGGAFTITLPTAVNNKGLKYQIVNSGSSGATTIATTSSQTIDGSSTATLTAQYEEITLVSNGTNWFRTSRTGLL